MHRSYRIQGWFRARSRRPPSSSHPARGESEGSSPPERLRSLRLVAIATALTLLSACAGREKPLPTDYTVFYLEPPGEPISSRVLLVSDSQFHHLYGDGSGLQTAAVDLFVQTAIRPAQLDLYGADLFRWTLDHHAQQSPAIFLGDASDLSCGLEFDSFVETMRSARAGWVFLPGNHDGYFYGNAWLDGEQRRGNLQLTRATWEATCRRGGGPLTRNEVIRRYLRALSAQTGPGFQDFARYLEAAPDANEGDWRMADDAPGFLRAVHFEIDEARPWRSFIVQRVDLSLPGSTQRFSAILTDTSQYRSPPVIVPRLVSVFQRLRQGFANHVNAGLVGNYLSDQVSVLDRWIDEARARGDRPLLMGHHPYDDLERAAQRQIDRWRSGRDTLLYVSAHTHHGHYDVHGKRDDRWLELNVGSILDWPPEFRAMQLVDLAADDRLLMTAPLYRIPDLVRQGGPAVPKCQPGWEARPEDPDYYLAYLEYTWLSSSDERSIFRDLILRKHSMLSGSFPPPLSADQARRRLLDVLLHSYDRLIRAAPTRESPFWPGGASSDAQVLAQIEAALEPRVDLETKVLLLTALARFEGERYPTEPEVRRDFRLCQALFASKYEFNFGETPQVEDWLIAFPK